MGCYRAWIVTAFVVVGASCKPGPGGGNPGGEGGLEGGAAEQTDGGEGDVSTAGDVTVHDAGPGDATQPNTASDAGSGPAGMAGADAFCAQICTHEAHCAVVLDASPAGLSGCMSNCQSANESSTANPPTELLRADYVSALGSCISASSCTEALATSEQNCAASVVSGGSSAIKSTQTVSSFCAALAMSPCFASDASVQNCESGVMLYSDKTLQTTIACLSNASCSTVTSCYDAAFTQP